MGKLKQLKKGDSKALSISHPNSRKAKSLAKKIVKASTRDKTKSESAIKRNLVYGEKLMWFHDNLESGDLTADVIARLFEKYLCRFDEELEQIAIKHSIGQRKGRQHASREDIINLTKKRDLEEYNTCGIEMVDILNPKQLKLFREWDGNLGVHFKLRRFSKSFVANYKPPVSNSTKPETSNEEMAVENIEETEVDAGCETRQIENKCSPSSMDSKLGNTKPTMEVEENGT